MRRLALVAVIRQTTFIGVELLSAVRDTLVCAYGERVLRYTVYFRH